MWVLLRAFTGLPDPVELRRAHNTMKTTLSIALKVARLATLAFVILFVTVLALNKPNPDEIHAQLPEAEGFVGSLRRAKFRTSENLAEFDVKNYGVAYVARGRVNGSEREYLGYNNKWVVTKW